MADKRHPEPTASNENAPRARVRWAHGTAALGLVAIAGAVSCGAAGFGGVGAAMCPELGGGGDVLGAQFDMNARINAKVRAFVQASKDMANISAAIDRKSVV